MWSSNFAEDSCDSPSSTYDLSMLCRNFETSSSPSANLDTSILLALWSRVLAGKPKSNFDRSLQPQIKVGNTLKPHRLLCRQRTSRLLNAFLPPLLHRMVKFNTKQTLAYFQLGINIKNGKETFQPQKKSNLLEPDT